MASITGLAAGFFAGKIAAQASGNPITNKDAAVLTGIVTLGTGALSLAIASK